MSSNIYLSRKGEICGPFSQADIDQMQKQGSLERFSWIWDDSASKWKSIDAAPAMSPQAWIASQTRAASDDALTYCVSHHEIHRGRLEGVSSVGCQFVCEANWLLPPFVPQTTVSIHQVDSQGGGFERPMRVGGVEKRDGRWVLFLRAVEVVTPS
jgi:hypothetical protein